MVVSWREGLVGVFADENGAPEDTLDVCLDPLGAENHMFVRVPIPQRYRVDQMQSFADILLNKADGLSATVADGRANMHAVDAALASVEKGEWVDITRLKPRGHPFRYRINSPIRQPFSCRIGP